MIDLSVSILSRFHLSFFVTFLTIFFTVQTVFSQDTEAGASLFKANCASCHYLGPEEKKLIGPGLSDEIFEEYTQEWLYSWIRNSSEMIESGDKQAIAIYEEYNKAVMTAFPYFSDSDIDNILYSIESFKKYVLLYYQDDIMHEDSGIYFSNGNFTGLLGVDANLHLVDLINYMKVVDIVNHKVAN